MNVLASSVALLKRIDTYHFASLSELAYSKITSISSEDLFYFENLCGWVDVDDGKPVVTKRGYTLLKLHEQSLFSNVMQQMLMDYVLMVSPIWSNRIPYGRSEAAFFMTKDEKACFTEAGLLSKQLDFGIVDWWDTIANQIRKHSQQAQTDIGRMGERHTIQYEKSRTATEPKWIAVDSNLAGYDVKSQKEKDDPTSLLIEVKASSFSLNEADFHITSHEWYVAATSGAYVFHLWCFADGIKRLAIISSAEIQPYIPTNHLKGQWESVKIPFACFESKFTEIV